MDERDEFLSVGDHVALFRRRWKTVTSAAVLGLIGGVALSAAQPGYSATTTVLAPGFTNSVLESQVVTDQESVMRSDEVVDAVIAETESAASQSDLLDRLDVSTDDGSNVIEIAVTDSSGERAASTANAFASAYFQAVDDQVSRAQDELRTYNDQRVVELDSQIRSLSEDLTEQEGPTARATRAAIQNLIDQRTEVGSVADTSGFTLQPPTGARILQEAATPAGSGFAWFRGAILGLMVGLLFGIALAYFRDLRDDRFREPRGGEVVAGAPVVARLPHDVAAASDSTGLAGSSRRDTHEALTYLATSVQVCFGRRSASHEQSSPHMILLSSTCPGDGCSAVAMGLAATLAGRGTRVGVLDLNAVPPRHQDRIPDSSSVGAADQHSEFLAAGGRHPRYVVDGDVAGVRLLSTEPGPIGQGPRTNVADAGIFRAGLPHDIDVLVVDAGALGGSATAVDHLSAADQILVVVRPGRTPKPALRSAISILELAGHRASGVVLNAVDTRRGRARWRH